jgi:glycosyltransferase involved in cell wall biosynthesis
VRIAVLHPQTAFVRGGAELHTEALTQALRDAGHDAEIVQIAGKWYYASEIVHQMAVWRSFDITESNGMVVDAVIALKFPAYLATHDRKIVWLIHQHRAAYELWDHAEYGDLAKQEDGRTVRELIHTADRMALGEAKRIFTNSKNVAKRLWDSLQIPAEVLYHPSPPAQELLTSAPGAYGDYVFYPSRLEVMKRQQLVIEAMQHVTSDIKLVLVGRGPDERALRDQIELLKVGDRVRMEIGVSHDRLLELYRGARAVYNGPYDEDYGYVTIEGLAAERPVVTLTDAGGPLEFVEDGATGLVTPPDPKAIAAAFDRLSRDTALSERLGKAGNALVREVVPTWPEIVTRLLDR